MTLDRNDVMAYTVVEREAKMSDTLRDINRALKAEYKDLRLVRGAGYFFFIGKDAERMHEQGIYQYTTPTVKVVLFEARIRIRQ